MREERLGSGEGGYLRGRRICLGNVVFCSITLF